MLLAMWVGLGGVFRAAAPNIATTLGTWSSVGSNLSCHPHVSSGCGVCKQLKVVSAWPLPRKGEVYIAQEGLFKSPHTRGQIARIVHGPHLLQFNELSSIPYVLMSSAPIRRNQKHRRCHALSSSRILCGRERQRPRQAHSSCKWKECQKAVLKTM